MARLVGAHPAGCAQVKFTSWPSSFDGVLFDDVVSCPSANGNGFAILNNTVGNLRGRAALIKSSNGVVAGNTFFNLMNWAVEMAPEYRFSEADFVHGILFADNVINSNGSGIWIGIDPWKCARSASTLLASAPACSLDEGHLQALLWQQACHQILEVRKCLGASLHLALVAACMNVPPI